MSAKFELCEGEGTTCFGHYVPVQPKRPKRCPAVYPGAKFDTGAKVRCELPAGHEGQHAHSFAARYWESDR